MREITATEYGRSAREIACAARVKQLSDEKTTSMTTLRSLARLRGQLLPTTDWSRDELISFILDVEGFGIEVRA